MNPVRPVCVTCGAKTEALATVMDPFMDSCYGVCRDCLSSLHQRQMVEIGKNLDRLMAEQAEGGRCSECGRDLHGYRGPRCRYCDGTAV